MNVTYKIARVSTHQVPTQATLPSGETVKALVDSVEVEIVPVGSQSSSVTLRYVGAEMAKALSKFQQGDTVMVPWDQLEVTKGA